MQSTYTLLVNEEKISPTVKVKSTHILLGITQFSCGLCAVIHVKDVK